MASTINASTTLGLVNSADTSGVLQLQTSNTAAVTIDASQNVGVGMTPVYKLDVTGGNGNAIRFTDSVNSVQVATGAYNSTGFIGTLSNHPQLFYTNGAERMRVDTAGNLGLGVTPSAWASRTVLEVGAAGNAFVSGGAGDVYVTEGCYYNAGWKYGNSLYAPALYNQYRGTHAWLTAPSGTAGNAISFTQAMTLDASGNLGVGTTSPAVRLNVTDSADGGNSGTIRLGSDATYYAQHQFRYNSSEYRFGTYGAGQFMSLYTAGSERARIDSSGNLLVGTTSIISGVTAKLAIYSADLANTANTCAMKNGANSTGGAYIRFANYLDATIGSITQNTSTSVLYNVTSDQRLKENIQDADSASSLIDSLQVRQFDWKADGNHQRYGFVAQELVTVAPEAVHQPADPKEMMAVDYSKLVPMFVKEIQSLRQRVAQLETN